MPRRATGTEPSWISAAVIDLDPESAWGYRSRGFTYIEKGEHGKAIRDLTKAIELDPNSAMAYCNRGYARAELGDYNAAIADSTKAIELDPLLASAYHNRAITYCHMGDYDKAWADVKECQRLGLAVDPEFLAELRNASGREE